MITMREEQRSHKDLNDRLEQAEKEIAQLKSERDALTQALDTIPELIFIKDSSNRLLYANKPYRDLLGLSDDGYFQKNLFDVISPVQAKKFFEQDKKVITSGSSLTEEETLSVHGGEIVLRISKTPFDDHDGKPCVLGVASDITEYVRKNELQRSSLEQVMTSFADKHPQIVINVRGGRIIEANSVFKRLFDVHQCEHAKIADITAFHSGISHQLTLLKQGLPFIGDTVFFEISGTTREFFLYAYPVDTAKPGIVAVILMEITGKHTLNEKLHLYEGVIDSITGVFYRAGAHFSDNYFFMSDTIKKMTGYGKDEINSEGFLHSLIHSEDYDTARETIESAMKSHSSYSFRYRIIRKDGEIRWILDRGKYTKSGKTAYRDGILLDITNRYLTRLSLLENKQKTIEYEMLINRSSTMFIRWKKQGSLKIDFVSDNISRLGYTPHDFSSRHYESIIHPDDFKRVKEEIRGFQQSGRSEYVQEYRVLTKNGDNRWVLDQTWAVHDTKGEIANWYSILIDITESKEIELALAEERERLLVTLRAITDGVFATDILGTIVLANDVAVSMLGLREPPIGHLFTDLFAVNDRITGEKNENIIAVVLRTKKKVDIVRNSMLFDSQGKQKMVEYSAAPIHNEIGKIIGVVIIVRDVTLRFKLEQEANKAEQLESLGILAGGIAHDFNNILTAIYGNISLAKMYSKENNQACQLLASAEKACVHAKSLSSQLLTFSKGGSPVKRVGNIEKLLVDTITFILRGSGIRIDFSIANDLWLAEYDDSQIVQVINNLVINAKQSIQTGGIISVSAKNSAGVNLPEGFDNHRYLHIEITDNGSGITPENLSKIFDPYFTTKESGSGLGLATCYSIMKKHGGHIAIESEHGKGTKCILYLPASYEIPEQEEVSFDVMHSGSGKVLIMDDEEMVRNAAKEYFKFLGYFVDTANDGDEALSLLRTNEDGYNIGVFDITVPGGLGGKEIIQEVKKEFPDLFSIVSSGYSEDPVMADFKRFGFDAVLVKPYSLDELSRVLNTYAHWKGIV